MRFRAAPTGEGSGRLRQRPGPDDMGWVINYQDPETQQPGLDRCATSTCWRWDGSPGSASAGRPRGRLAVDDRSHPIDRCGQDLAAGAHVQPDVADAWTAEARPRAERHPPAGEEGGARVVAEREPADRQPPLRRLYAWATSLQDEGLARLLTYFGKRGEVTLLPRLQPDNAGLVTVWNFNGAGYLSVWRSVFERSAPRVDRHRGAADRARVTRQGQHRQPGHRSAAARPHLGLPHRRARTSGTDDQPTAKRLVGSSPPPGRSHRASTNARHDQMAVVADTAARGHADGWDRAGSCWVAAALTSKPRQPAVTDDTSAW